MINLQKKTDDNYKINKETQVTKDTVHSSGGGEGYFHMYLWVYAVRKGTVFRPFSLE